MDFLKATAGERACLFAERYEAAVYGLEWPVSGGGLDGGGDGGGDDPDDSRRRGGSGEDASELVQEAVAGVAVTAAVA